MTELPSYQHLPSEEGAPPHSAWGLWGPDDTLGCWNKIDAAATARGLAAAGDGRVFRLDRVYDRDLAKLMERDTQQHDVRSIMGIALDDNIDGFNTQSGSQWDGFGHFRSVHGFYNGLRREEHGVAEWPAFVTRGVLADVGRWRKAQGRPLDPYVDEQVPIDELLDCLEAQGTVPEPGDVLLLNFGWMQWYEKQHRPPRTLTVPGILPTEEAARVLWDLHVAAVGGDSGLDPFPGPSGHPEVLPDAARWGDTDAAFGVTLHNVLPWFGMSIGEFLQLESLAASMEADGDWTCLLTIAPMRLPHGVATPANTIAVR